MFLWSSFLALLCVGDPLSLAQKLALLTLPTANACFLLVLAFSCKRSWFSVFMTFLAVWLSLYAQPQMALTNSLFAIHPIMLYGGSFWALQNSQRRRLERNFYNSGFLLALALILGGFWSMQELNWGGWWNWDVLELGAAHVWVCVWASAHVLGKKSAKLADLKNSVPASLALSYYLLNKTGLAVSIHSFVTSSSLRLNVLQVGTLIFFFLSAGPLSATAATCTATAVYSGVVEANALKVLILWVTALLVRDTRVKRPRHAGYHALVRLVVLVFVALNFNNSGFSVIEKTPTRFFYVTSDLRFALKTSKNTLIWDKGWFSKPTPACGSFRQSRSLNGYTGVLAYRK